ncbi:hypothetical protein JCM12856_13530 [Spirochaeta dissipatitropha]
MIAAVYQRLYMIAFVDTAIYVVIFVAYFNKKMSAEHKILLLVVSSYLVGLTVLLATGPDGAGYIWFISAIVLSALFSRRRMVTAILLLSTISMLLYALAIHFALLDHGYNSLSVLIIASNLLLISLVLVYLIVHMLESISGALRIQSQLAEELKSRLVESQGIQAVLSDALEKQSDLLQELHHRVQNNLQLMSSLVHLQIEQENFSVQDILQQLHAVTAVNDIFLENPESSSVDLERLIRSVIFYSIQNSSSFSCALVGNTGGLKANTQDACVIAVGLSMMLKEFSGFCSRCNAKILAADRSIIIFADSRHVSETDDLKSALQRAVNNLLENTVIQTFFTTVEIIPCESQNGILLHVDRYTE